MGKKEAARKMLEERHLERYKKKQPVKKKPSTVVIGKAYTLEEIQKLLGNLRSEERDRAITASIQFMSDNRAIAETVSKIPDLSMTSITEYVLEIVKRDLPLILGVLEETKRTDALRFLAKSEKMTPEINTKAKETLDRIEPEPVKLPEKKEEVPGAREFSPMTIQAIWKNLNSRSRQARMNAAITVFTHYSSIAKSMPKVPLLTISQLIVKAKDITHRQTDPVFRQIIKTWNRAALGFLATSESIPPEIQERAKKALEVMAPTAEFKAEKPGKTGTEAAKPEKRVVIGEKEYVTRKPEETPVKYDIPKVKQLWTELNSKDLATMIQAAIRVFTNYQDVARVLPSIPMLTVSQVVNKASDIASRNMTMFFKKLSDTRNRKALEFMSQSQAVPPALSKRAKEILEFLLQKEKKEGGFEPKVIFKEAGEPDDES